MSIAAKCICSSSPYCDGRDSCLKKLNYSTLPITEPSIESYIDRAIAMLKEEYENEFLIAGYNGIVSLLTKAKELAQQTKI